MVQFGLVDKKELVPLDELNEAILAENSKAPRWMRRIDKLSRLLIVQLYKKRRIAWKDAIEGLPCHHSPSLWTIGDFSVKP